MSTPDPLSPKALPGPGLRQWLREAFTGRPTPLLCMQVEVSSVCACRCTYCPHTTKKDVWQSRLMNAETFAALWPLMRQCGRVHLQGWGEPFLHPRFMDFVSVARRAGCAVSTTTCGQHMDESLAAAIVDSGMDVVAFSLAGTDEASNASRQGIPFSRVCEAIRCLQEVRRKKQGVHLEVHLAYLLLPSQLEAVKRCFDDPATAIATLVRPFAATDGLEALENPNSPKVVLDAQSRALYFSRSVIPYLRGVERSEWLARHTFYKHIGLYAFRTEVLRAVTALPQSALEKAESLEQLRWLENGYKIGVGVTDAETIGIDTPEDLEKAEAFLIRHGK